MPEKSKDKKVDQESSPFMRSDFSKLSTRFTNIIDELVEFSEHDPELAEGLKWIDGEAQKRGISFYEMVHQVLTRYDVDAKAADWIDKLRTKND